MAKFIFFVLAETLPFHLFAYVPFWNHLRFPKRITAVLLILEELLFLALILLLTQSGVPVTLAQFVAIPIYGTCFFYFVKMYWGKIAFLYIFTTDYLMAITGIVSFLGNFSGRFVFFSWQAGVLTLLLFFLTSPFMLRYICKTAELVFSIDAPVIWKTIWLLPLSTSIIVLLLTYPITETNPHALIARILMLLCMFLIYYHILLIIQQIQKQAAIEEQARSMEHLIQIQARQYALLHSQMEETRRARHDLRQHWAALKGCLDSGDLNALADYIKHYCASLPADSGRTFCNNFAVNAVLNFYADKAAALEIPMKVSFQIGRQTIIPEPEFCVLLGNLLENALDACACMEKKPEFSDSPGAQENHHLSYKECFIRVNARQNGDSMLSLTVDNTSPQAPAMEGEQFRSSKHDGFGLGTISVRLIADRYHGDARFQWKDGVFYASVMLNP